MIKNVTIIIFGLLISVSLAFSVDIVDPKELVNLRAEIQKLRMQNTHYKERKDYYKQHCCIQQARAKYYKTKAYEAQTLIKKKKRKTKRNTLHESIRLAPGAQTPLSQNKKETTPLQQPIQSYMDMFPIIARNPNWDSDHWTVTDRY